jgi:hypothetical protein
VFAVEFMAVFSLVAARRFSDLRGAGGHDRTAQRHAGRAHAHQYPSTLEVELL